MSDSKLLVCFIIGIFGLVLSIYLIIFSLTYLSESSACSNFNRITGAQTEVTVSLGCMVKYRGEWVELEVATKHKQDVTIK